MRWRIGEEEGCLQACNFWYSATAASIFGKLLKVRFEGSGGCGVLEMSSACVVGLEVPSGEQHFFAHEESNKAEFCEKGLAANFDDTLKLR